MTSEIFDATAKELTASKRFGVYNNALAKANIAVDGILSVLSTATSDVHDEELKAVNLELLRKVAAYRDEPLLGSYKGLQELKAVQTAALQMCKDGIESDDYSRKIQQLAKIPLSTQTVKESGEFKRERQALSDNLKNAGNALRTTGHYTGAELNKAVAGGGGGAGGASSSGGGAGAGGAGGGRMDEDDGDEEEDEEDGIAVVTQQGPGAESKLKCPVTKKLFDNPVRNDACGHIYDRKGIEMCKPKAAGKAWVCPVAGCKKPITTLIEDTKMAVMVAAERERQEREQGSEGEDDDDDDDDSF